MTHTILINVDDGETICEQCPFRTDTGCNNRGYFNCKEFNLATLIFANKNKIMTRAEIAASAYCDEIHSEKHQSFRKGYQQAEKDLALTWKDMRLMNNCLTAEIQGILPDVEGVYPEHSHCEQEEERFYKNVLRRFNEARK